MGYRGIGQFLERAELGRTHRAYPLPRHPPRSLSGPITGAQSRLSHPKSVNGIQRRTRAHTGGQASSLDVRTFVRYHSCQMTLALRSHASSGTRCCTPFALGIGSSLLRFPPAPLDPSLRFAYAHRIEPHLNSSRNGRRGTASRRSRSTSSPTLGIPVLALGGLRTRRSRRRLSHLNKSIAGP